LDDVYKSRYSGMAPFLKHQETSAWEIISNGILNPTCDEAQVMWSNELKNDLKNDFTYD